MCVLKIQPNYVPKNLYTGGPPYLWIQYPWFQLSAVYCWMKKFGKLKKQTVHEFQNARQARMGRNMVRSSSPNASSTWLIFLCPRTHASPQTFHHSASSDLTVLCSWHTLIFFYCGFLLAFLHILYVSHKLNLLMHSSHLS